jgi:hypothetical protein
MKKLYSFLLLLILVIPAFTQFSSLEKKLFELPDVIFTKVEVPSGFEAAYELSVKQPIDHNNLLKGYFYQRVFLSHRGFKSPVVFVTEGYEQPKIYRNELTTILNANQVEVEHRYFGISMPDSPDYDYLNVEQEASDLHHINQLLKEIYPGKWVSTGISKGGQNSIYYRYFFPGDVDVTVPYVAPLNLSLGDDRIYKFLDTVNTDECRNKIRDFQIRILKEREKVMPLLKWYSKGKDLDFTYLNFEQAFEYTVLEYSFSFWQWGHSCSEIPPANSSLEDAVTHLLSVSDIDFFADETMKKFESHYYQAAVEVGYYSYRTEDFKGLLKALPMKPYPSAIFTPGKMKVNYNSTISKKVYDWTQSDGNNILYIYGAADTWSATSVPPSTKTNSQWFFLNGASHGTARIKNMSPAQKALFTSTLEKWLGMELLE